VHKSVKEITVLKFIGVNFLVFCTWCVLGLFENSIKTCISKINTPSSGPSLPQANRG